MDAIYISMGIAFCVLVWGLAKGCARLQGQGGRS